MSDKQYRLLNIGEKVRQGDEFYQVNQWHLTGICGFEISELYSPFRRLIDTTELAMANAEIERLKYLIGPGTDNYQGRISLYRRRIGKLIEHKTKSEAKINQLESELATLRAEQEKGKSYNCCECGVTFTPKAGMDSVYCEICYPSAAPLPPMPEGEGWIAWHPLPDDGTVIEIVQRDGERDVAAVEEFDTGECGDGTITHYRIVPPPKPAFVVDKPGVYRRRNGEPVCVTENSDKKTMFVWRESGSTMTWNNNGEHCDRGPCHNDLVAYLSPLPPASAGPIFEAEPGKPLPRKFWCYSLCGVSFGEWEIGTNPAKCEGNEHWLYAEYREPKAEPQNAVEADLLEGMAWFLGKLKSGATIIAAPARAVDKPESDPRYVPAMGKMNGVLRFLDSDNENETRLGSDLFWCKSEKEWRESNPWNPNDKCTMCSSLIYARRLYLSAISATQTIIAAPTRDGWVEFVGAGEVKNG